MLFLIDYNRTSGQIVALRQFEDAHRQIAEKARLELELKLKQEKVEREIVLLDAASLDALQKTHRRYFKNVAELVTAPR